MKYGKEDFRTMHHENSQKKLCDRFEEDVEEAREYTDSVPHLRKGKENFNTKLIFNPYDKKIRETSKEKFESKKKGTRHRDRRTVRIGLFDDSLENENLSTFLENEFSKASEEQPDELDFFTNLVNNGITIEDIKENLPEQYEYSKNFMESHGLI